MAEEEQPTFGALLSRYRLAAGLTQQELANRAELSVRGISDLERGVKTRPRAYTVRHLAEALTLADGDRDLFERSALHAPKRLQNVPMDEHTQAPTVAGRSVDAPSALRVPLLHGVRSRQQLRVRYIGAAVIVVLAMGALVFTLRPRSTEKTVPFARLVASWAIAAPSPSKLAAPTAIAIGDRGIVYVADSGADRIDAFSAGGRLLFSWGAPGRGPGQLRHPKGLAPDAFGHIYVADTGNNRIDKFSAHGRYLGSFGTRGTRSGRFRSPEGSLTEQLRSSGRPRMRFAPRNPIFLRDVSCPTN
jgi:transcriptional regulator with XRE-family HTH domain